MTMPRRVVKVLVMEGDEVEEGQAALHKNYKRLQEAVVCSEPNYHL